MIRIPPSAPDPLPPGRGCPALLSSCGPGLCSPLGCGPGAGKGTAAIQVTAVIADQRVWMGGDSAACAGTERRLSRAPKVVRCGPLLIGATGYMRHVNLLPFFVPPELPPDADVGAYVAGPVVDALRTHFKDAGRAVVNNGVERAGGAGFLIGCRGRLFFVDDVYGVTESRDDFDAIGSGGEIAWGVLWAYHPAAGNPKTLLDLALSAAAARDSAVAPPFTILHEEAPDGA